jgi:hypothetical protein
MRATSRARDLGLLGGAAVVVVASMLVRRVVLQPSRVELPGSSTAAQPGELPRGASLPPPTAASDATPVHGCEVPDRGLGRAISLGRHGGAEVFATDDALAPDGSYSLVLHLHGGAAARRLVLPEASALVLATIDRGASSSAYTDVFRRRADLDATLAAIDAAVGQRAGTRARADRLVLSAWSAGYAGVAAVLTHSALDPSLRGVVLVDSVHAAFDARREPDVRQLEPFLRAARRALEEPRFGFLLTHSSIATEGYASTTQSADTLLELLRVSSDRVELAPALGLRQLRVARERGFELRGFAGAGREDHCAQLALLPELLGLALGRR